MLNHRHSRHSHNDHQVPNTSTPGTVFVVDDDEALRDSLTWLLEANRYIVRCFSSADQFLASYMYSPERQQVGCLILDVRMPGMSGLELQERLLAENIKIPTIFITGHGDVPMAVNTMKKGAFDFIEKPFDEKELCALVERMLAKSQADLISDHQRRTTQHLIECLTTRERQVLERIAAGRLNKQIAGDLNISIKTVEAHRANIMEKMNVSTVADLLRITLPNLPMEQQPNSNAS